MRAFIRRLAHKIIALHALRQQPGDQLHADPRPVMVVQVHRIVSASSQMLPECACHVDYLDIIFKQGNKHFRKQRIFFGVVAQGEEAIRTITVSNRQHSLRIEEVNAPEWLEAEIIEITPEEEYQIRLTLTGASEPGFLSGSVGINLVDSAGREVIVPVYANTVSGRNRSEFHRSN